MPNIDMNEIKKLAQMSATLDKGSDEVKQDIKNADTYLEHNINQLENSNSPFQSPTSYQIKNDTETLLNRTLESALSGLGYFPNKYSNVFGSYADKLNQKALYDSTGDKYSNLATETTNLGLQGLMFVGTGSITSVARELAMKTIAKETGSKLANLAFKTSIRAPEEGFNTSVVQGDMMEPKAYIDNGKIKTKTPTLKQTAPLALAFGTGLNTLIHGVGKTFKIGNHHIANKKFINKLNESQTAKLNPDFVIHTNHKLIQDFEPLYKKYKEKNNYNGTFEDFIKNKLGITSAGSDGIFLKIKNGSVDDLFNKLGKNQYGAFIDDHNNVLIKDKDLGTLRGKDVNGNIIIDINKSELNNVAKSINGKPIIMPFKQGKAILKDTEKQATKEQSPFIFKDGEPVAKGYNQEDTDTNIINKDNYILNKLKSDKDGLERSTGSQIINKYKGLDDKDIERLENIKNNEINTVSKTAKILNSIDNEPNRVITSVVNEGIKNGNIQKVIKQSVNKILNDEQFSSEEKKDIAKLFFEDIEPVEQGKTEFNTQSLKNANLKDDFIDALKKSAKLRFVQYGLNNIDKEEIPKEDLNKLTSSIVNTAFDLYGKSKKLPNIKLESLKKDLTKELDKTLTTGSHNIFTKVEKTDNPNKMLENKGDNTVYKLHDDFKNEVSKYEDNAEHIEKTLEYLKYKDPNIRVRSIDSQYKDNPKIDSYIDPILLSRNTYDNALREAKQDFIIKNRNELRELIDRTRSMDDDKLLEYFDSLNSVWETKAKHPEYFETVKKDKAKQLKRELDELEDLLNATYPDDIIRFNVKIAENNRIMHSSIISPKNSKIARMFIVPKELKPFEYSNEVHKEAFMRYFVDEFGDVEPAKDLDKLTEQFDNLYNTLTNKNNLNFYEQKALEDIEAFKKGKSSAIAEADGVNNGYAMVLAQLGIENKGVGIGKDLDKSHDLYTQFKKTLNSNLGDNYITFSRKDVKKGVIANMYGAGSKAITDNISDELLLKSPEKALALLRETKIYKDLKDDTVKKISNIGKIFIDLEELEKNIKTEQNIKAKDESKIIYKNKFDDAKEKIKKLNDKNNYIDFLYGYVKLNELVEDGKVEYGLRKQEYEALKKSLTDKLKEPVGKAIDEVMPEEYKEYFETFQDVVTLANVNFTNEINKRIINHQQIIDDILKFYRTRYGKEFDETKLNNVLTGSNTYKEVADSLIKNEILKNEEVFALPFIKDKIPYFYNGFGDKVYLIKLAGTGYDRTTGMRFATLTPRDLTFPIFNISHDASLSTKMGNAVLNIYDGIVGGSNIIDVSKELNKNLGQVYKYINPYISLRDTYEAFGRGITEKDLNNALEEMAKQKAYQSGIKPNKEYIKNYKNTNKKRLSAIYTNTGSINKLRDIENSLVDKLNEKIKEVDKRKQKIQKNSDKQVINQYTIGNGMDYTKVPLSDIKDKPKQKRIKQNININQDYNTKYLESIPVDKINLEDTSLKSSIFKPNKNTVKDNVKVEIDTNAKRPYFDINNNKIVLNSDKVDHNTMVSILHEFYHKTVTKSDGSIKEQYKPLVEKINKLFPEIHTQINPDKLFNTDDEALAHILSELTFNELLFHNKDLFAKLFSKDGETLIDLDKFLRTSDNSSVMKYVSTVLGKDNNFYTTKDFLNYLRNLSKLPKNNPNFIDYQVVTQLEKSIKETLGTIDSSTDIRELLLGKNFNKFKPVTTGKNITTGIINRVIKDRTNLKESLDKINDLSLFDIFRVDANREALEKALAIKKGVDQKLQELTSNIYEESLNNVDNLAKQLGTNSKEMDETLGKSILLGLNVFAKDEKIWNQLDFSERNNLLDSIKNIIEDKEKLLYRTSDGVLDKGFKDEIDKLSVSLSKGKLTTGSKLYKTLRNRIQQFLERSEIYNKKPEVIDEIAELVKMKASYNRIENFKAVNELIKTFGNSNKHLLKPYLDIFNRTSNKYTLFGENITLDVINKDNKLVLTTKEPKSKYIVATAFVNDKKYFVIEKEHLNQVIGKQESEILDYSPKLFEKGIYRLTDKKKKVKVFINAQNVNTSNKVVGYDYSRMLQRNFYMKQKQDTVNDTLYEQYKILKDSGFLVTEKEYSNLDRELQDEFVKLPSNHPISQVFGRFYFNKRYAHHLLGSKGVNLYKTYKSVVGNKQLAKTLTNTTKLLFDAIQILRGLVLTSRPSSYINSFVSSHIISLIHGTNIGDFNRAKKMLKEYKQLNREYAKKYFNEGKEPAEEFYNNVVKKHPLHVPFTKGLVNTIRMDAYKLGTFESNEVYKLFETKLGSNAANTIKMITLDPSTKIGSKLGTVFDNTELIPKIALYLSQERQYADKELALQYTLMAYPTYNNLNPLLNAVDQFSPYTKYWYNIPKMLLFASEKNPRNLLITQFLLYAIPYMTYIDSQDKSDKWYEKNGFAKLSDNTYYYMRSLNPFNIHDFIDKGDDMSKGGFLDLIDIMKHTYDPIPFTINNK